MTSAGLADWRVIFATPGTPPRKLRAVRPADDPELPDWLIYVDGSGREVCRLNRDLVLFVERLDSRAGAEDAAIDDSSAREILESSGFAAEPCPPRSGLAKVAAAIRSARGGDPPTAIQGFA